MFYFEDKEDNNQDNVDQALVDFVLSNAVGLPDEKPAFGNEELMQVTLKIF